MPLRDASSRETVTAELHDAAGRGRRWSIPVVDGQAVAEMVAGWTGIPVGRMQSRRDPHRAQPARDAGSSASSARSTRSRRSRRRSARRAPA